MKTIRAPQRDLFSAAAEAAAAGNAPLAERMRPKTIAEVVGQGHVLAPGAPLRVAIESGRVTSMILWGPPGCGKTTLARLIAHAADADMTMLSAVLSGVADVRAVVAEAMERRRDGRKTVLFVDEIHRFNKSQQDAFLPHVESGTLTLLGATTENPSFSIVAPLLSRCRVVRLAAVTESDIEALLSRAHASPEGLGGAPVAEAGVFAAIASSADGDARYALGELEALALVALQQGRSLDVEFLKAHLARRSLRYDRQGDEHHHLMSAFIKSMRGTDPDASVYYMMRMLEAGEDPGVLLRRMIVFASEDIGNADPRALQVAVAADAAHARIGLPESTYALSQCVLYLATAPKSNASTTAWVAAKAAVAEHGSAPVPLHLRNASTQLMRQEGYGQAYRSPHEEPDGIARGETYLPEGVHGRFYEPTTRGYEKTISERLAWLRSQSR